MVSAGYFESRKPDDITLMRFLRSRKFNVPVAKKLYIDAEKWREEYGVEEIMTHVFTSSLPDN